MEKIVITPRGFANQGRDQVEYLRSLGYQVVFNDTGKAYGRLEFLDLCQDADGVIAGVERIDSDFFESCPKVRAVVKFGVGMDNFDLDYMKAHGIYAGRCPGSNSRSVAETAVTFMLASTRQVVRNVNETRQGSWNKNSIVEFLGKTVGIVGFGAIGREVARMCNGLGMKVLACDVFPISEETEKQYNIRAVTLDDLLSQSDFVTVHVPLNPETAGLISLPELKMMKNSAVLINTARGGIVEENDLFYALKNGLIASAWFDVFSSEPPKAGEKLLTLDNFFLTPHIAARSAEAERNTVLMATAEILKGLGKND
ncbi:MAG: phosphoglycerate dehydrogenase [Erysipelotrichaceae bacterium]|nr:phosphoglycerate dehydrogenase [Erysipelotrichaceae bacterium]